MARLATQLDRLRRFSLDSARLAVDIGRVLRFAVAPPADVPGIAVLAGDERARRGRRAAYRVRVHNPTDTTVALALEVRGGIDDEPPVFALRAELVLEPDGVAERWLVCTWAGAAELLPAPPADVEPVWLADGPVARWRVDATLADGAGRPLHRLEIGGQLLG